MRRLLQSLILLCALGGVRVPATAQAVATPSLMNFQGRLAKPDGTPVANGNYSIRFSLYTALTGGTKLWEQTLNPLAVRNGTFAAQLNVGANFQNGATAATLFNGNLFLEIKIGADAALTPRQPLTSVAYAQKAGTVPDGSLTASKFVGGVLSPTGAAGGDLTGTYPNPELKTATSSLYKVSGTLLSAIQGGSAGVDVAQTAVTAQNQDEAWQSFTPTQSGNLTAIDVYIGTTTGINKTIPLTIYAGEGTTGGVLRQVSITVTPTMGYQNFTISPPVALTGGQKYTFYIGRSASLQFGYASNDLYAGGTSDIGPPLDYAFRTYMNTGASGRVNVNGDLTTSGSLGITNNKVLELGFGVAGKEGNAGKIGYQTFSGNALDLVGAGTSGTDRKIRFYAEGGSSFNGNLGIGTTAPGYKLHVLADMGSGSANDGGIVFQHTNLTQGIGFGYNTIYATGSAANQNLNLLSRGTGSVILNPTGTGNVIMNLAGGNVGIGTFAPAAKLDVNGNARITGALTSGALTAASLTAGAIISGPIASGAITAGGAVTHGNVLSLSNFATDTAIGTAAATVDQTSTILINQTTTFRALTLPTPTNTTAGRMVRIVNIGTAKFQVQGAVLIPAARAMTFLWTGAAWIPDTNLKRVLMGTVNIGDIRGVGANGGNLAVTGDFQGATSYFNVRSRVTMGWSLSNYSVIVSCYTTDGSDDGFNNTTRTTTPTIGNQTTTTFDVWIDEYSGVQKLLLKIMVVEQ